MRRGGVGPCVGKRTEPGLAVGDGGERAPMFNRSRVERARRSRRVTMSTSPVLSWSSARRRWRRSAFASLATSRNTVPAPAALSSNSPPGRQRSGRLSRLSGVAVNHGEVFLHRISGREKLLFSAAWFWCINLAAPLMSAYPTPGRRSGSSSALCPLSVIGCGRPDRLKWVVSGPSPRHIKVTRLRGLRTFPPRRGTGRTMFSSPFDARRASAQHPCDLGPFLWGNAMNSSGVQQSHFDMLANPPMFENRPTAEASAVAKGRTALSARHAQAYLWALPLINTLGMKLGSEKIFGAGYNVLPI